MTEQWKDIDGYEGLYQVSDRGRAKRVAGGPSTHAGRILKPIKHPNGYLTVTLYRGGKSKQMLVHRLVAIAFLGDPPPGCEVNHKNGDKTDNRTENLEWVTASENMKHAYRVLGKQAPCVNGEAHGCSKLMRREVIEIRKLSDVGGHTQAELAEMFGVSKGNIGYIVRRKSWKHVP